MYICVSECFDRQKMSLLLESALIWVYSTVGTYFITRETTASYFRSSSYGPYKVCALHRGCRNLRFAGMSSTQSFVEIPQLAATSSPPLRRSWMSIGRIGVGGNHLLCCYDCSPTFSIFRTFICILFRQDLRPSRSWKACINNLIGEQVDFLE